VINNTQVRMQRTVKYLNKKSWISYNYLTHTYQSIQHSSTRSQLTHN